MSVIPPSSETGSRTAEIFDEGESRWLSMSSQNGSSSFQLSPMQIEIRPLADYPETIPVIAQWFFSEWHQFDSRSRSEVEHQLLENLNRDSLPITFVAAVQRATVVGSVSLDLSDLPGFDHLSPWLASLYVVPEYRRLGLARSLIRHAIDFGRKKGVRCLYLWTPGPIGLYEEFGWRTLCVTTYTSRTVAVMELRL